MTFYEEDFFDAYDDRYSCAWLGYIVPNNLDDLSISSDIWIGWDVSLQGEPAYSDCANFDPALWSEDTPTTVLENLDFGLGFGPAVQATYDYLYNLLINDYGWTEDEWEENYGPHMYSQYIGLWDTSYSALIGFENGIGRSYETDEAYELVWDSDGYATPIEVEDTLPDGYSYSFAWNLWYAETLLL